MNSDLDQLIEELQKEKIYLEGELDQCMKEWDFIRARAFSIALSYTREKLKVLRNLENPNYDRILSLIRRIEDLKSLRQKEPDNPFIDHLISKLPLYEKELEDLLRQKKNRQVDTDVIIDCLEQITNEEIKRFCIQFDHEGIGIEIESYSTTLQLLLKRIDSQSLNYAITQGGMNELIKMGFQTTDEHAILFISDFGKNKIPSTLTLISRIIYDVLALYGGRKAKIIYFSR